MYMKKFLLVLIAGILFSTAMPAFSASSSRLFTSKEIKKNQTWLYEIGFRLLNANKIDKRIVFAYSTKSDVNASSSNINRTITVYDGLMQYVESEDELAAILAHEISHSVDSYNGIFRGYLEFVPHIFIPRKYERKADLRAVDYMVNAGYNPVALIVIMNKAFPQYRYEVLGTHPLTTRRMAMIYEYIYTKYPAFLANNIYQHNVYYQNFLLNSEKNRKKLAQKIRTGSNKKIKYDY